jgi:multidrug transporter EmrE-like cation transporter
MGWLVLGFERACLASVASSACLDLTKEFAMRKVTVALLGALLAGYALLAWAQARIDVRTAITPMGSSSSNGVSFAWFYDSADRSVIVCRTAQAAGDAIDCKAKTQLP